MQELLRAEKTLESFSKKVKKLLTNDPDSAIIQSERKRKEVKKMTKTELIKMVEKLKKQGNDPHGYLRELLIEMQLDEKKD